MQLVVRNLCGSVFFGCGGVGTQDSLGLVRYAGSSELFWKHFWAWGQENVGSCVFCCSGDLSVSKNNPTQSPEHWWEPPSLLEFPGFQVCERPCVTRPVVVVGGLVDARLAWLPALEKGSQSLATPGPGLAAALFCRFSCCQRIFLGTNDSAT